MGRIRSVVISSVVVLSVGGAAIYAQDASAGIHRYIALISRSLLSLERHANDSGKKWSFRWLFLPLVGAFTADDPEKAHEIAVMAIGSGFAPKDRGIDDDRLAIEVTF